MMHTLPLDCTECKYVFSVGEVKHGNIPAPDMEKAKERVWHCVKCGGVARVVSHDRAMWQVLAYRYGLPRKFIKQIWHSEPWYIRYKTFDQFMRKEVLV